MPSLPFDRFVAPARARPELWRLFLGTVLVIAVYLAGAVAILGTAWWLSGTGFARGWLARVADAATPDAMLLVLATFAGMMLGPAAAVRLLHRRRAGTLFGPAVRVLHDFVVAAAVVLTVLGLSLAFWAFYYDAVPNVAPGRWLLILPLSLLGLLVQTGAEEVVFRGYLLQQLAARFRSPIVWMGLPAFLFGIVHFDPVTSGANAWLVVASATLFGLLAADLTHRTGSLGAAWGFHFANNTLALLLVATDGTLTGLSLYRTPYGADDAVELSLLIPIDLGVMLASWWLVRRLLER